MVFLCFSQVVLCFCKFCYVFLCFPMFLILATRSTLENQQRNSEYPKTDKEKYKIPITKKIQYCMENKYQIFDQILGIRYFFRQNFWGFWGGLGVIFGGFLGTFYVIFNTVLEVFWDVFQEIFPVFFQIVFFRQYFVRQYFFSYNTVLLFLSLDFFP